ncbi:hypothetical protein [Rhodoblastus sp.]|uniref:hypothetical protein n=1 Tax=Rhodoblastus sp. TaxID=1962975 RepID=UPI0025FD6965|nr:hypothetical protein [Rhodoblastus sp.]
MGDAVLERVTTTQVGRGLYLLKYVSSSVLGLPPVAIARPAAGNEAFIEVISAPGVSPGLLSCPGEALVVHAKRPGELSIKLIRQSTGASYEASFALELIAAGEGSFASGLGSAPGLATEQGGAGPGLRICAHVARRGDVEVSGAQWIAGPGAPAAIEGLEIRGALPAGVRIDVQVLVATNPPRWFDWAPAGVFAGTRGRATPLVGLRLRLAGEASARFALRAEALFLGAAIVSKRGREVELVGSGAADPLVGLRLDLECKSDVMVGNSFPLLPAATNGVAAEQNRETRVRVFRASSQA